MKLTLELDTSAGEPGYRAAIDVLARLFQLTPATAPLAPPTVTASIPPQAPAPTPAPSGAPPAAAPPMQAPLPPAASVPSAPPMAPPAAAAPPAPPAPTAPTSGVTLAQFAGQVQAFATKYGAKGAKARFGEIAAAYQQPGWTSNSAIPADKYEELLAWFKTE